MGNLIPKEQLKSIPELYASTILKDPICKLKYFYQIQTGLGT